MSLHPTVIDAKAVKIRAEKVARTENVNRATEERRSPQNVPLEPDFLEAQDARLSLPCTCKKEDWVLKANDPVSNSGAPASREQEIRVQVNIKMKGVETVHVQKGFIPAPPLPPSLHYSRRVPPCRSASPNQCPRCSQGEAQPLPSNALQPASVVPSPAGSQLTSGPHSTQPSFHNGV